MKLLFLLAAIFVPVKLQLLFPTNRLDMSFPESEYKSAFTVFPNFLTISLGT